MSIFVMKRQFLGRYRQSGISATTKNVGGKADDHVASTTRRKALACATYYLLVMGAVLLRRFWNGGNHNLKEPDMS